LMSASENVKMHISLREGGTDISIWTNRHFEYKKETNVSSYFIFLEGVSNQW
jgi:hypothetical protein